MLGLAARISSLAKRNHRLVFALCRVAGLQNYSEILERNQALANRHRRSTEERLTPSRSAHS